ncbi:MAG: Bug family tripartite tricarboxylate transporter substrate binding protein [Burkholderiales bacterium]
MLGRIAAAGIVALAAACTQETNYPSRPIRLIVPFPAGGSSDIIARVVSESASRVLGQQIVIENRAGAGGNVGTESAARAPADGYTLVECTIGTCAINLSIYKGLHYDLERDFQPVVLFGSLSNVLTVHPSVPAKSVGELVEYARKNPGKLTIGSSGYGSSPHLAAELLKQAAGVDIVHVPYRGSAPAIIDLRGGQIHMFFDNTASILPHVKSADLRALAVTGPKRLASLPDVPTMEEAGFPGFVIAPWFGALAPKKTPRRIIDRLNQAYNAALADPNVAKQFAEMELIAGGGTPEAFQSHIRAEVKRWGDLVKARGIHAEELR